MRTDQFCHSKAVHGTLLEEVGGSKNGKESGFIFIFETFTACAEISCQAGHMLVGILRDFRPEKLEEYLDEMHKIENSADMKSTICWTDLQKSFIPTD